MDYWRMKGAMTPQTKLDLDDSHGGGKEWRGGAVRYGTQCALQQLQTDSDGYAKIIN